MCHRESGDKPGEVGDHAQYGLQLCLVVWGSHFSDPLDRVRVRLDAFSCQSVPKIAHVSHAYDALFLVELHPSLSTPLQHGTQVCIVLLLGAAIYQDGMVTTP